MKSHRPRASFRLERTAERQGGLDENAIKAVAAVANTETQRLLADYARLQEDQRATDRLAFRAMDLRVNKLRSELETVALNTESSFEQTHENLTRLVALSSPADGSTPE